MKKTVVIGASDNPERYAFKATIALQQKKQEAIPVGLQEGEINGIQILVGQPDISEVDTVSLYVSPQKQPYWYDYILSLKPRRVIFNPGTENPAFESILVANNIEILEACTLVMLSIGNY